MTALFADWSFISCFAIVILVCYPTAAYEIQNKDSFVQTNDAHDLRRGSQYIGNREIVEDDYLNSETENKLLDLMLLKDDANKYQQYKPMYANPKMEAKRYGENSVGSFMGRYKQYQIYKLRESLLQQMLYPNGFQGSSGRKRDENIIKYLKRIENAPAQNWQILENLET